MTLATNTGNAVLDAYAKQINALEDDPNATPDYDAALETWYAAVKAQLLGQGGTTANPGSGPGKGSGPDSGAPGTSTSGSPGTVPLPVPEADSINKIASTAGPDAASSVQQIADGAAASIGGSDGAAVAAAAAQAGADAAQHVIDSGGTPAQAQTAATTAAQAAATAGEAGGPTAAVNVGRIGVDAGPATAQAVASTAAQAASALGGGTAGAAVAAAVSLAGTNAAAVAVAGGAGADVIATASTTAATAAADAAASVTAAGGTAADATAAAAAAADAAAFGGAAAATSVATAAATGGVAAAQAVAAAAENAFKFAGGAGATAIAAGATAAEIAATTVNLAAAFGMTAADAAAAGQLVADAAAQGGADLAGEVSPAVNMVALGHGTVADMTQFAGNVTQAFDAQGIAGAHAVSDAIGQAFQSMLTNATTFGGQNIDFAPLHKIADTVADAVASAGPDVAGSVTSAVTAVASAGGTVANMQTVADEVVNIFHNQGQAVAEAVGNAALAASGRGMGVVNDVLDVTSNVAARGGSPADISAAGKNIMDVFDARGQDGQAAADNVRGLVESAFNDNVNDLGAFTNTVSQAEITGGDALANDVARVASAIAARGGSAADITAAGQNITNVFNARGQNAADTVTGLVQTAISDGVNRLGAFTNAVSQAEIAGGDALANDVAQVATPVAMNGGSARAIIAAGQNITDVFNARGQGAADTVTDLVRNAINDSVGDISRFVRFVSRAEITGGDALASDMARIATTVATNGGNSQAMTQVRNSVINAFTEGGQAAADAIVSIGDLVADAGGTGSQVGDATDIAAFRIETEGLTVNDTQEVGQFARGLADHVQQLVSAGTSVNALTDEIAQYAPPPPV
jgi:trimeric autotransporter adhesin